MRIYQLKPCKGKEYFEILNDFQSFVLAQEQGIKIDNVPKLIDLIKQYFGAYLYYIDHRKAKMIVEVDGKFYESKIGANDENGNPLELEVIEIFPFLLKEAFGYLASYIDINHFINLIEVLNAILLNQKIDIGVKIFVIDAENNFFQNKWHLLARGLPYELASDAIKIRKNILIKIIQNNLILESNFNSKEEYTENIKTIYKLYEFYSMTFLKMLIANSHFLDIQLYIQSELKKLIKTDNIDHSILITFLLRRAVLYNNLFLGLDKDSLYELVDEYEDYIEEEDIKQIHNDIAFDPQNFELGDCRIKMNDPDFSKYDENEIETILQFVVPYRMQTDSLTLKLNDEVEIYFNHVTSLYQDPIFSILDEMDIAINGMPLSFFSDVIGNLQKSTLITIKIPYFDHPQFDIVDNKYIEKDLKLEAAKRGGKYYPHKDIIIEKLFEAFNLTDFPLDIKQENITSEFISNYMLNYFTKYGERIHHELYTITNFNSYFNAKNRYLQELNKFIVADDLMDIKKFIENTNITNERQFLDFCYKFLKLTIQKSIEYGGLNNNFWENKLPISETKAQSIIFNNIRYLAEMKGVQISRETVAANGSLDFHFSYNNGDKLLKVCVELKNAHHNSILHGIKTQLPLYINDIGRKEGIFLVLWYKGKTYNEPSKYDNIEDLIKELIKEIPKKYKIKTLVMDCSPKVSPSKPGSDIRLKQ